MVEAFGGLINTVVVIILLAVFVEMLLPDNSMSNYLKLIMGLFLILAILTPVMHLLDKKDSINISTWYIRSETNQLETILSKGEELSDISTEAAIRDYANKIEGQMVALIQLIPGVESVCAKIHLPEDSKKGFVSFKGVDLWVMLSEVNSKNESSACADIKAIKVDLKNDTKRPALLNNVGLAAAKQDIEVKITETLSNFYTLDKNKVNIFWEQ